MSFIDELQIHISAGKGGDGVVRWKHEKGRALSGPSGGNGGKGADVYIKGSRDTNLLYKYRFTKEFKAENGVDGGKDSLFGRGGEDLYIDLPIGSVVTNMDTLDKYEVMTEGEAIKILKGGRGGLGNENFKSSRNQAPEQRTLGEVAEEAEFSIEIRLVADVGLIGLPSAGKSSLLNALTRAEAKVGAYPFTTLDPNLGNLYGVILADIPGLIEGASDGKGLGHKFLRHIRRVGLLAHCISMENEDLLETHKIIRNELGNFDSELLEKEEIILLTKTDLVTDEQFEERKKVFGDKKVIGVSIHDPESLKVLSNFITRKIKNVEKD